MEHKNLPPDGGWYDFYPIIGIMIKETLSEHGIPCITVVINGNEITAVIDTAAFYCIINEGILNVPEPLEGKVSVVRPDKGLVEKLRYALKFKVKGSDWEFSEEFVPMVKTGFPYDVVLGTKFLRQCKSFTYYGTENRFELVI